MHTLKQFAQLYCIDGYLTSYSITSCSFAYSAIPLCFFPAKMLKKKKQLTYRSILAAPPRNHKNTPNYTKSVCKIYTKRKTLKNKNIYSKS